MKYDEKTGKKIPENRTDEVKLTMDGLKDLDERCNGFASPSLVTNTLLSDINVSLGLLVDIAGSILNRLIKAEKTPTDNPLIKHSNCSIFPRNELIIQKGDEIT